MYQKQHRKRLRAGCGRTHTLTEQVELHLPLLRPIFVAPDCVLGGLRGPRLSVGGSYSCGKRHTNAETAGSNKIASRQFVGFHRALQEQVLVLSISPRWLWPKRTLT